MTNLDEDSSAPAPGPEGRSQAETTTDTSALAEGASPLVPPEVMAQTLPEYLRGMWVRIKSGESGMLPVVLGLIVIVIVFQAITTLVSKACAPEIARSSSRRRPRSGAIRPW